MDRWKCPDCSGWVVDTVEVHHCSPTSWSMGAATFTTTPHWRWTQPKWPGFADHSLPWPFTDADFVEDEEEPSPELIDTVSSCTRTCNYSPMQRLSALGDHAPSTTAVTTTCARSGSTGGAIVASWSASVHMASDTQTLMRSTLTVFMGVMGAALTLTASRDL